MKSKPKPDVEIIGGKDGWVIRVNDDGDWKWDIAVTDDEIKMIKQILNKKIK